MVNIDQNRVMQRITQVLNGESYGYKFDEGFAIVDYDTFLQIQLTFESFKENWSKEKKDLIKENMELNQKISEVKKVMGVEG